MMDNEQQDRLDEFAAQLRQMVEQEEAELFDMEKRVKAKRQSVGRIYRAIRELTGENEKQQRKRKASGPKVAPSAESIQKVRAAFESAPGDSFSQEAVMEYTGLSHDTVRRTIAYLRESEVVRRAGMHPDTRKHMFKLMPELIEAGDGR
jgi:response regulator of citrate/malate metabolism